MMKTRSSQKSLAEATVQSDGLEEELSEELGREEMAEDVPDADASTAFTSHNIVQLAEEATRLLNDPEIKAMCDGTRPKVYAAAGDAGMTVPIERSTRAGDETMQPKSGEAVGTGWVIQGTSPTLDHRGSGEETHLAFRNLADSGRGDDRTIGSEPNWWRGCGRPCPV